MTKDQIFNEILVKEGGYVNHPSDKGGPTNWGITERVARAHGYAGDMRNLTREQALAIYEADYWYGPRFNQVSEISPEIAAEICDTGVNMGPQTASRFLQRWLNAFNLRATIYPDMQVDGVIGPRTLSALKAYLARRGADGLIVMLRGLNGSQAARYLEIAENNPKNEDFIFGQILHRVEIPAK